MTNAISDRMPKSDALSPMTEPASEVTKAAAHRMSLAIRMTGHRMIFKIVLRIEVPPYTVFSWSVESSWFIMPSNRLTFS